MNNRLSRYGSIFLLAGMIGSGGKGADAQTPFSLGVLPPCTIDVPAGAKVGSESAIKSFQVIASAGSLAAAEICAWHVESKVSWVIIISPADGIGSDTVDYIVKKNTTGTSRAGRIMVNGKRYEVMQSN